MYFTLASKTMLGFHSYNHLIQCNAPLPDELQKQRYSSKYGFVSLVRPSSVNPMDKWKASRAGSPCKTNHSPLDKLKVGEEVVQFLTFSCRLMCEKQTGMRRQVNGVLGELKTDEEENLTTSTIVKKRSWDAHAHCECLYYSTNLGSRATLRNSKEEKGKQ